MSVSGVRSAVTGTCHCGCSRIRSRAECAYSQDTGEVDGRASGGPSRHWNNCFHCTRRQGEAEVWRTGIGSRRGRRSRRRSGAAGPCHERGTSQLSPRPGTLIMSAASELRRCLTTRRRGRKIYTPSMSSSTQRALLWKASVAAWLLEDVW